MCVEQEREEFFSSIMAESALFNWTPIAIDWVLKSDGKCNGHSEDGKGWCRAVKRIVFGTTSRQDGEVIHPVLSCVVSTRHCRDN